MGVKLNLGCGNKKISDFIGVDRFKCSGADVVADLMNLPFKPSIADEIILDNVVEHIQDTVSLMKEIYRVSENKALCKIRTPHFTSESSWRDPTHYHHWSIFSIDYFTDREPSNHYVDVNFKLIGKKVSFSGFFGNIGKLIYFISPKTYEKVFCFIFRAGTLSFKLQTIKEE